MLRRRLKAYGNVCRALACNVLDRTTRPAAMHFVPTWDCNMQCRMCSVWKRGVSEQLNTASMISVIKKLYFLDVVKVIGGEPFKREDITELGLAINEYIKPFLFQIITNGVLTEQILAFAEQVGNPALHIRVSLDGFRGRHEALRGRENVFDQIVTTLKELAALRAEKGFVVGINFNITDESLPEFAKMVEFGAELGVDVVPGIPVTPFLTHVDINSEEKRIILLEHKAQALDTLGTVNFGSKHGLNLLERLFLKKSNEDIFRNQLSDRPDTMFPCLELRNLMYLFPNGDLVTCGLNHTPVGNLMHDVFDDIWFGREIGKFREQVDECPGCLQAAIEIVSRLYGGALRPTYRRRLRERMIDGTETVR